MKRIILLFVVSFVSVYTMLAQKNHTVKQGETLQSIAIKYQVTVDELKKANPSVEMVFSGLLLNIPQAKKIDEEVSSSQETTQTTTPTDTVKMKDGSYILCKVVGIKQGILTLKQEGEDGTSTVMTKDVSIINYTNGTKKRFKK